MISKTPTCFSHPLYDPNKAMGFFNFLGNRSSHSSLTSGYSQILSDSQSGFRAISREVIDKMQFKETDMAFATEC
jgi:hypothetical protein